MSFLLCHLSLRYKTVGLGQLPVELLASFRFLKNKTNYIHIGSIYIADLGGKGQRLFVDL